MSQSPIYELRVAAVVLAAGGSRRMGSPKQLLRVGGRSLVVRAVEAAVASRCDRVFVVLGAAAPEVSAELEGFDVELLSNSDWPSGVASSIRSGLRAVMVPPAQPAAGFDAALLVLADQPAVDARLLDQLVAAFDGSETGAVACEYAGTLGVPALFGRRHFEALCGLKGDTGAKSLLVGVGSALRRVAFEPAAIDIDTRADYDALLSRAGSRD